MKSSWEKYRYIFNRKQKIQIVLLLIGIFIGTILELAGVSIIMPFINAVMKPEMLHEEWYFIVLDNAFGLKSDTDFIIFIAIILILTYILKNLFLLLLYDKQYKFTYDNRRIVATRMINAYLNQPYSFHRVHSSAELMRNIETDTDRMFQGLLSILQIATEGAVCITLGIYLFIMDKSITIGVGTVLGIYMWIISKYFKKHLTYVGNQNRKYAALVTKWMQQSFGGIKETKILERESYFQNQFDYNYRQSAEYDRKYRFMGVAPRPMMEMVTITALLGVIVLKLINGTHSEYFVTTLSIFAIAAFRLLPSASRLTNYMSVLSYSQGSVDSVYNALTQIEAIEQMEDNNLPSELIEYHDCIRLNNVSFCYPDAEENVLTDVSIEIKHRKSVALIGPSGAGKTTLADLILGVMEPTSGSITVDGKDINRNLSGWHQNLGYIPQTIYLMDTSIRENVAFGIDKDQIDDEKLEKAMRRAQLWDFVCELPEGMDTIVGESGVRLSGGQRQRIGIARALYNDPEVLVLDEATSALDNETETAVMEAIDSLSGNKTLIIIAHRLTTIRNCDVIYEVKDSKVTEVNNPLE